MVDQGVARGPPRARTGTARARQVGSLRIRHPPAHDMSRIGVDDEGIIDGPDPRRHVRQARHPQSSGEETGDQRPEHTRLARSAGHASVTTGAVLFTLRPRTTLRKKLTQRTCCCATGHHDALSIELAPHAAHPAHAEASCTRRNLFAVPAITARAGTRYWSVSRDDPPLEMRGNLPHLRYLRRRQWNLDHARYTQRPQSLQGYPGPTRLSPGSGPRQRAGADTPKLTRDDSASPSTKHARVAGPREVATSGRISSPCPCFGASAAPPSFPHAGE